MNNRGQALIEFILILPILLLIIFVIIDLGTIYMEKNKVEDVSIDVIDMLHNNKNIDEIKSIYKDYDISSEVENEYRKVVIKEKINIITPGLEKIIGDPYEIKVERYITNDA